MHSSSTVEISVCLGHLPIYAITMFHYMGSSDFLTVLKDSLVLVVPLGAQTCNQIDITGIIRLNA